MSRRPVLGGQCLGGQLCENFLYGFKAALRGRSRRRLGGLASTPAAAPAPAALTPAGWRERRRSLRAGIRRVVTGSGPDLTREPSRRLPSG